MGWGELASLLSETTSVLFSSASVRLFSLLSTFSFARPCVYGDRARPCPFPPSLSLAFHRPCLLGGARPIC
ncbi:hypothetical protein DFJ73DRAFT_834517 [Zopfochytrium polystomum]|nr:hypothetical protein DFJ73DRAFT_834517 [Zopfochytrium polystomum]